MRIATTPRIAELLATPNKRTLRVAWASRRKQGWQPRLAPPPNANDNVTQELARLGAACATRHVATTSTPQRHTPLRRNGCLRTAHRIAISTNPNISDKQLQHHHKCNNRTTNIIMINAWGRRVTFDALSGASNRNW